MFNMSILVFIVILILILMLGLFISFLAMRLFFNRKSTIEKAIINVNHSGNETEHKGFKINEIKDGMLYQFKYTDGIRIVAIPDEYGFDYKKGKRSIYLEAGEILPSNKDEKFEIITNIGDKTYKFKLIKREKLEDDKKDNKDYNDLIKALTVSKLAKDGVNAMGDLKGTIGFNLMVFIIAVIIGAGGMWYYNNYLDNQHTSQQTQQTQQTEDTQGSIKQIN